MPLSGLIALVILLYYPALTFEYVWDDVALFVESSALRGGDLLAAITQPILPGTTYFRPAVLLTFYLEFLGGEPLPAVSHLVNILIHLANIVLVYLLSATVFNQGRTALPVISASIYALHPALLEPVLWVAGRFDMLCTFFVLIASCSIAINNKVGRVFTMSCAFFLALCSKEMAITFPLIWCYLRVQNRDRDIYLFASIRRVFVGYWYEIAALLAVLSIYLLVRTHFMSSLYHQDGMIAAEYAGLDHLYLVLSAVWFYIKLLFVPFGNLSPIHTIVDNIGLFPAFLGFSVVFALLSTVIASIFRRVNIYWLGLCLVVVVLAPVLHIIPLTIGGNIGHERFMVLPVALFACVLPILIVGIARRLEMRGMRLGLTMKTLYAGLVVVAIFTTWSMSPNWKNNITLWAWAYEKNKNFSFVVGSYLASLANAHQFDLMSEVLDQHDSSSSKTGVEFDRWVEVQRAMYYTRVHDFSAAITTLDTLVKAIGEGPHKVVLEQGIALKDVFLHKRDLHGGHGYRGIYGVYAEAYLGLRDFENAEKAAAIALFYQPDYAPAMLLRSMAMFGLGDYQGARFFYEKAKVSIIPSATREVDLIFSQFYRQFCIERSVAEICSLNQFHQTE